MGLKERKEHYAEAMENDIDLFLKEKGDEFFKPDSIRSKEMQLAEARNTLRQFVHGESVNEVVTKALALISSQMPQTVPKDVWDKVNEEFSYCEENLLNYLEADDKKTLDEQGTAEETVVSIYEMCGLTLPTLNHCYALGQLLYDKKEFVDSRSVMLFLMQIAPQILEFWVAAAMCNKQMGKYQSAIDLYTLAQKAFPDHPSLYFYCADAYLANGDNTNAKIQLEMAKKLFDVNQEEATQWNSTYDYLTRKVA